MKQTSSKMLMFLSGIVAGAVIVTAILFAFTNLFSYAKAVNMYPIDIMANMSHSHSKVDVPNGKVVPTVQIHEYPDPMKPGNFSLNIKTTGFIFSPEHISTQSIFGEGHAHVYIDDVLFARAYSNWFHIPKLKAGKHKIYVTLNYNDHKEYSNNGKTIGDEIEVEVGSQMNNTGMMKM